MCQEQSSCRLSGEGPQMPWAVAGEWITPVGKAVFWLQFAFQCEWGEGGDVHVFLSLLSQPVKLRQDTGPRSHFP